MVAQTVEPLSYPLLTGKLCIGVAFLHDELTPNLPGGQAGIEPPVSQLWVGLALPIHDGSDVSEQVGQAGFGRFASAQMERITAGDPASQFVGSLADGFAFPAELALGEALSTFSQFLHGSGHEQTPGAAFERFGGFDKQVLETIGQFHCCTPA